MPERSSEYSRAGGARTRSHLLGAVVLAWMSGGAIALFGVALSGGFGGATGSVRSWAWDSPWSLACLALAGALGLAAAGYIGRLRQRELEREFIDRRLEALHTLVDRGLAEAHARAAVSQERDNAG